jgi:Mn-dependent DtxR family transcriptional regulator
MAELDNKAQVVLEAMKKSGKELKTGEIAEIAGLEKQEVSKIITKLKKLDLVYSPKRCYYKAK